MALDFGNYLLSSSPPGFEYLNLRSFRNQDAINGYCRFGDPVFGHKVDCFEDGYGEKENSSTGDKERHKKQELTKARWEIRQCDDDEDGLTVTDRKAADQKRISNWNNVYTCDCDSCNSSSTGNGKESMKKKTVVFADDCGLSLIHVREMTEPSNVPPNLQLQVLSRFNVNETDESVSVSTAVIDLRINFSQPAADYIAFREKLERANISLENAILKNNLLIGTVKVKNISFNKKVKVRCTFDGWKTFTDIVAVYSNSTNACFDTFSFQVNIPSDLITGSMQFAVWFESDGAEYWDNNDGKNYEVVRDRRSDIGNQMQSSSCSGRGVFVFERQDSWSDFSGWAETDPGDPYW